MGSFLNRAAAMASLLLLSACAQTPSALTTPPPTYVGGGQGSQFGNYQTFETGEFYQSLSGPCPISAWDRPISGGRIIRYLSAACPALRPGHPDAVRIIDLDRQVLTGTFGS